MRPGIAYGWQGHAWLWLQLVASGCIADRPRTRHAIQARLRRATQDRGETSPSLFIGAGGSAVVAALVARLDPGMLELAAMAIAHWIAVARASREVDVMAGAAGACLATAEIEHILPGRIPRGFMIDLHARCERELDDIVSRSASRPVRLGLAHGVAGYLLALEAGAALGLGPADRTRDAALGLLEREQLVVEGERPTAMWSHASGAATPDIHGWCHGTPGVALALVAGHRLTGDARYRDLASAALHGILAMENRVFSTCCGVLGRIQVLIEAHRITGSPTWLDAARSLRRRARLPDRMARVPRGDRRKLWDGIPGVEYVEHRLRHPDRIPFPGLGPLSVGCEQRAKSAGVPE